jgi:hypothetical protein
VNHTTHLNHISSANHNILVWLLIGLIAGYITGKLMRGAGFGPLMDIVVGIVGAQRSQLGEVCGQPRSQPRLMRHKPRRAGYDLWNMIDIVEGDGIGVTSVSCTVLPLALKTKVFSRCTLPSAPL